MTNARIIIRNGTISDIPALVPLLHDLFSIEADFSADPVKQENGLRIMMDGCQKHRCLKVAETASAAGGGAPGIVGMCSVQTLVSTAEGGIAAIVEDLVVKTGFRGNGIGRMLLSSIEKWCAERGIHRIQLLADADNRSALAFYDKMAWRPTRLVCLRKRGGEP